MIAVFRKELADHLASTRFFIFYALVLVAAIFAIYIATQTLRSVVTEDTEFVFITIFTTSSEDLPLSFLSFLALFIPIISIVLGFDAINSERNSGNLSRLLSQPIYRDAVINGKFLAGLAVLAIIIVSVIAIVAGLGLRIVGVAPSAEEVFRLLLFALVSIVYGAFWMALAVLFSILFRSATTSILASLGLWIFFFFFMPIIAGYVTQNSTAQGVISLISPCALYGQATSALLMPELDALTAAVLNLYTGRLPSPFPLSQSLLLVWPELVAIIALAAICFAISYVKFMREEIKAI